MQKITAKFFRSGMQRCIAKYAFPLAFSLFSACGRQAKQEITLTRVITGGMYLAGLGAGGLKGFGADGAVRGSLGWGLGVYNNNLKTTAGTATTTTVTPDFVSVFNSMEDGEMDYETYLEELKANKRQANGTGSIKHRAKNNATSTASPDGAGKNKQVSFELHRLGATHATNVVGGTCLETNGDTQADEVKLVTGLHAKLGLVSLGAYSRACLTVIQGVAGKLCRKALQDGSSAAPQVRAECDLTREPTVGSGLLNPKNEGVLVGPHDRMQPAVPSEEGKDMCDQIVGHCQHSKTKEGTDGAPQPSYDPPKRPTSNTKRAAEAASQVQATDNPPTKEPEAPRRKKKGKKGKTQTQTQHTEVSLVKGSVYGNKHKLTGTLVNSGLPGAKLVVNGVVGNYQGDDGVVNLHITNGATPAVGNPKIQATNGAPPAVGNPAVVGAFAAAATVYTVRKYANKPT